MNIDKPVIVGGVLRALSNAFVAMTSARAYRSGLPVNKAIDALPERSDEAFDRQMVASLFQISGNRSDWKNWQAVQESQLTCP